MILCNIVHCICLIKTMIVKFFLKFSNSNFLAFKDESDIAKGVKRDIALGMVVGEGSTKKV